MQDGNDLIIQNEKYLEIVCVRDVQLRDGFVVHLTFTDGTERDVDLDPYIGWGPIFAPIRNDPALFRRVYVDPESQTLAWPNGADIAPGTLYYEGEPPWAKEAKPRRRKIKKGNAIRRRSARSVKKSRVAVR